MRKCICFAPTVVYMFTAIKIDTILSTVRFKNNFSILKDNENCRDVWYNQM